MKRKVASCMGSEFDRQCTKLVIVIENYLKYRIRSNLSQREFNIAWSISQNLLSNFNIFRKRWLKYLWTKFEKTISENQLSYLIPNLFTLEYQLLNHVKSTFVTILYMISTKQTNSRPQRSFTLNRKLPYISLQRITVVGFKGGLISIPQT